MPPKKQQNQPSSTSKVKVDKVSEIHPYPLSHMPTTYADLWLEECAFHLLATGSSTPRTDTPLKKKKNKSAKVQKQVAQIQAQASTTGKSRETLAKEREKELRAKEKADEEKRRKEEAALFKPVQTQKVPFGVDPKTVLCEFFRVGRCEKGSKCKFSHDRNVERRVEKRNLYEDGREDKLAGASDLDDGHAVHGPTITPIMLQILWTNGTKKNYGVLSYPSMEIHGLPQM
jgi:hypothetical protein